MTVENYTNNKDTLEFVKKYGVKDLLECLNFNKWEDYLLLLEQKQQ